MTIPELISKLEKEIATVNKRKSDSASNNFIIRCEERVSAISDFILDLKNLNEETRKDSEEKICPHCHKYKKLQGSGIIHQLCECGD